MWGAKVTIIGSVFAKENNVGKIFFYFFLLDRNKAVGRII